VVRALRCKGCAQRKNSLPDFAHCLACLLVDKVAGGKRIPIHNVLLAEALGVGIGDAKGNKGCDVAENLIKEFFGQLACLLMGKDKA
jgi:hypothetical protein